MDNDPIPSRWSSLLASPCRGAPPPQSHHSPASSIPDTVWGISSTPSLTNTCQRHHLKHLSMGWICCSHSALPHSVHLASKAQSAYSALTWEEPPSYKMLIRSLVEMVSKITSSSKRVNFIFSNSMASTYILKSLWFFANCLFASFIISR